MNTLELIDEELMVLWGVVSYEWENYDDFARDDDDEECKKKADVLKPIMYRLHDMAVARGLHKKE